MPVTYTPDEAARAAITAAVLGDLSEATRIVGEIATSPRDAIEATITCLTASAALGMRSSAEVRGMEVGEYLAEVFAGCAARAEAV